jgi:hypothetical protein
MQASEMAQGPDRWPAGAVMLPSMDMSAYGTFDTWL